ncbi:MAG: PQQ-binding-like beta-propeller repeat protein [Pyrinomonadaceae bacterium]
MTKCWAYQLGDVIGQQIVSDVEHVFVGSGGGKVEALSLDGKKIWSSEFGGEITSNILAAESGLFLVTSTVSSDTTKLSDSRLRSLSKETGITNWAVTLPDAEAHFLSAFNAAVIVVSKNGAVQSIDAKQGGVKWKREIAAGFVAEPVFFSKTVTIATTGNQIFALSLATGEIESIRKSVFGVTALAIMQNDVLIAGDERGNIFSLNGVDKPMWTFKAGGQISDIFAVGDNLLAASHDNFVYFLVGRNGGRVWKLRLTGRVSDLAIGEDRYALISSFDEHKVMFVDLGNGKIAGQTVFDDDETAVQIQANPGLPMLVLTNRALNAYRLNGCSSK